MFVNAEHYFEFHLSNLLLQMAVAAERIRNIIDNYIYEVIDFCSSRHLSSSRKPNGPIHFEDTVHVQKDNVCVFCT